MQLPNFWVDPTKILIADANATINIIVSEHAVEIIEAIPTPLYRDSRGGA